MRASCLQMGGLPPPPPPTPPFFLSQASLLQSICHMHTLKCCKSIMPESCLQIWGPRPPPPPPHPTSPLYSYILKTHHARIVFCKWGGGGCAPSIPSFVKSRTSCLQSIYIHAVRSCKSNKVNPIFVTYVRKPLQQTSMRLSGLEALCVLRF